MIKYDFQRESKIPLLEVQGLPTVLFLKKRRFQCKTCRKVVVSETPIVKGKHLHRALPCSIIKFYSY
ncbi:transposase [Streptococcus sp. 19428wA2_WM07]|nr:transposase [Streptococcus sp. 19428wA2_WM07]TFU29029.1 transposase [Streptococcus sp. WM07]